MGHNTKKKDINWFKAILDNDMSIIKQWIAESASDINTTDNEGYTPLSWSCFLDRNDITHILLENGANPFISDKHGIFPWFISMSKNNNDDWENWPKIYNIFSKNKNNSYVISIISKIIKSLIQNEQWKALETIFDYINPNKMKGVHFWCESLSDNQYIPLSHLGYSLNKKDFITLLFKYDYDLDSVDYYNNTVLDIAFCEKNKDWIDYLFYMGAKQYKKDLY